MQLLHCISLATIGLTWIVAWRGGYRCCRSCGVGERASLWALACVVPTAALIFAVHLMALLALLSGWGVVTPEPVAVLFALLTLGVYRFAHRWLPRPAFPAVVDAVSPMRRRGWWLPVVVLAGMYGVFLIDATTRLPIGYDGLKYHLPVAVGWMQTQTLDLTVGLLHQSVPENGMIVPFLLSFARLERLLSIVSIPRVLMLAAVIYGLARAVGAGRQGATAALCIALSIPIVAFQSVSSYVDLYAAVSWLSALLALTWVPRAANQVQRRGLLLVAGLSAGVALGSRTTSLALVPLLGLVVFALPWVMSGKLRGGVIRPVRSGALFCSAVLVCSAFWFVRGAVQENNPIYPAGIRIGDRQLLSGHDLGSLLPDRSTANKLRRWWDYPWGEARYSGTGEPYSVNNALGAAYAAFIPLGLLSAFVAAASIRAVNPHRRWRHVYLGLVLGGAGLVLFVPAWEVLRYVLPLILLTVPLGVALLDRLSATFPRLVLATLTASLAITATIATLSPLRSLLGRVRDGVWDRASFYEIPRMIDDLPAGSRIVNLGLPPLTYPLLGGNLSNVVIPGMQWDLMRGEQSMSISALVENEIDYVYVREPWPDDWPDGLPMVKIFDDTHSRVRATTPSTRIYRVVRDNGIQTASAEGESVNTAAPGS